MRMHLLFPPRPARRPPQPPSPSPAPPPSLQDRYASLHFSHIRSTFEKHIQDDHCDQCCMQESLDAPCRSLADLAIDTATTEQPCEECIQECEEEDCQVQLTEQCTDQCVVVPCNDAHHDALPQNTADFMCVDGTDCSALDNFLQCCANMDYHQLFPDSKPLPVSNVSSSSSQWPAFTDPMFQSYMPTAPSPPSSMQGSLYYTDSASSTPQLAASPITNFQADPSPGPQPQMNGTAIEQQQAPPPAQQQQHRCMWAECGATFPSMNDLVGHVNLQHLRLPPAPQEQPTVHQQTYQQFSHDQQQQLNNNNNQNNGGGSNGQMDPSSLACLWADCRVYPTPASIPGPSMGDQANNIIGILASHLMQDHLGLTASTAPAAPSTTTSPSTQHQAKQRTRTRTPSPSLTLSSHSLSNSHTHTLSHAQRAPTPSPPTPAPEHDCTSPSAHICRWRHCGETFSSCDALTAHITSAHVGGGKAHYECFWEGCRRNSEGVSTGAADGESNGGGNGGGGSGSGGGGGGSGGGGGLGGFSSKQKICRHLQSHTGHRPFQCKICQQNFSEAATLAQHMRRHTQEKPYVCDFPGCGKSFAITGALTIHKRTHNGHKPFKCTFCDRAFTESSNLSKHLRTHTGVRPYPCTEPGCAKTFARPDQLARHMTVHRKKAGGVQVGGAGGRGNADVVKAGEVDVKA